MSAIDNQIYNYLIHNKIGFIPNLGTIKLLHHPAKLDVASQKFLPPYDELVLDKNWTNNQNLIEFVAASKNISIHEAEAKINAFGEYYAHQLTENKEIEFLSLGKLKLEEKGHEEIKEINPINSHFNAVPAEQIIKNTNHEIRVGESHKTKAEMKVILNAEPVIQKKSHFYLLSIIIALIGTGLILTHLFLNNFNFNGNQSAIKLQIDSATTPYQIIK